MTNREYVEAVAAGKYPDEPKVPLDDKFTNGAGVIWNLVLSRLGGAGVVFSQAETIRSNHYHKTDWHYLYVIDGEVWYYWRKVGDKTLQKRVFTEGMMFFTPPLVEHATFFPTQTRLLSLSRHARSHETHEADLVRVPLIELSPETRLPIVVAQPGIVVTT